MEPMDLESDLVAKAQASDGEEQIMIRIFTASVLLVLFSTRGSADIVVGSQGQGSLARLKHLRRKLCPLRQLLPGHPLLRLVF